MLFAFFRPRAGAGVALLAAIAAGSAAVSAQPAGAASTAINPGATIDEIIVTATLRDDTTVRRLPASIAVLDQPTLESAAVQHFEEVIALVPNLNWSGEGSRARYFQVRGTGELEQYEGAPNPSVGFIIDDIDFSDIGGIATTFDMDRVEVLRGPQGTRYGANALAGLIYARSAAPPDAAQAHVEALTGSDGTWGLGAAAGGPVPGVSESLTYRLAIQQFASDGFRDNAFLGRDDTGGRDELTLRGKLRWRPAPGWQADFTGLYVDLDNGYDDWAVDNSHTTQSDEPGHDTQRTTAGSLRVTGPLGAAVDLVSITGVADSDILFSFDSDWGNAAVWAPDVYAFSQRADRERRTLNQELRLVSTPAGRLGGRVDWLAGIYALRLTEDNRVHDLGLLDLADAACPPPPDPDAALCLPFAVDKTVASDYEAHSVAIFGELGLPLGRQARISLGLRGERRETHYNDQLDDPLTPATAQNHFEPTDRLWGGDLTLTRDLRDNVSAYGRIARGYKAGGFNPSLARVDFAGTGLNVSPDQVQFGPEALWNYEAGVRFAGERLWLGASAFWQDRQDMQVRVPIQLRAGDPNTFVFVTDNAQSARVFGMEGDVGCRLSDTLTLRGALGLLDTELQRFASEPAFQGRDFPHAPAYSFAASADWAGQGGWFARLYVSGRGSFYFDYDSSTGEDRQSDAAQIVNLRAGRRIGSWEIAGWVRNLFDEDYAVRGFYFGNEPPAFVPTRYIRSGDPRQVGVTVTWRL